MVYPVQLLRPALAQAAALQQIAPGMLVELEQEQNQREVLARLREWVAV